MRLHVRLRWRCRDDEQHAARSICLLPCRSRCLVQPHLAAGTPCCTGVRNLAKPADGKGVVEDIASNIIKMVVNQDFSSGLEPVPHLDQFPYLPATASQLSLHHDNRYSKAGGLRCSQTLSSLLKSSPATELRFPSRTSHAVRPATGACRLSVYARSLLPRSPAKASAPTRGSHGRERVFSRARWNS